MGEAAGAQCERCGHFSNECAQCGINFTHRVESYKGLDGQPHNACGKTVDNGLIACRIALTPR